MPLCQDFNTDNRTTLCPSYVVVLFSLYRYVASLNQALHLYVNRQLKANCESCEFSRVAMDVSPNVRLFLSSGNQSVTNLFIMYVVFCHLIIHTMYNYEG